jgi:hypothetical protein
LPRAPRSRPVDTADAIELLAKYHIVGTRKAKRTGEIIAIKHLAFGWITPKEFYLLEHIHDASGLLEKFMQGGYLAKQALWNSNATVAGIGIPVGLLFPVTYAKAIADAYNAQNWQNMAYWLIAFFAPFGDLLGIIGMGSFLFQNIPQALGGEISLQPPNAPIYCGNLQNLFKQHVANGNVALAQQVWDKAQANSFRPTEVQERIRSSRSRPAREFSSGFG